MSIIQRVQARIENYIHKNIVLVRIYLKAFLVAVITYILVSGTIQSMDDVGMAILIAFLIGFFTLFGYKKLI